jgi:very-short-patch-repair endonuclease
MTRLFNRKYQKPIRQRLRNNATAAERLLWSRLKQSQLLGYKFRRQQGIDRYVVDFYCAEQKLAIEIDGATNSTPDEIRHDNKRQRSIEQLGGSFPPLHECRRIRESRLGASSNRTQSERPGQEPTCNGSIRRTGWLISLLTGRKREELAD